MLVTRARCTDVCTKVRTGVRASSQKFPTELDAKLTFVSFQKKNENNILYNAIGEKHLFIYSRYYEREKWLSVVWIFAFLDVTRRIFRIRQTETDWFIPLDRQ